jgi:hypothetical protein
MSVRNYIEQNYSDIEKKFFDYIVLSFPEHILVQDGEESEDILLLLAILAKAFGSAKESILNLDTAHSFKNVFEKLSDLEKGQYYLTNEDKEEVLNRLIEGNTNFDDLKKDAYLLENNKKLLLPLAIDLNYQVPDNLTPTQAIDKIIEERFLLEDKYQTVKNRGNILALEQTMTNFAAYLKDIDLSYNIYEQDIIRSSNELYAISVLLNYLEGYVDITTDAVAELPSNVAGIDPELINVAFLKKGTLLDQIINEIRPAGIPYKILFRYASLLFFNVITNRAFRTLNNILEYYVPVLPLTVDPLTLVEPSGLDILNPQTKDYSVLITNNSNIASYFINVADWFEEPFLNSTDYASKRWRWVVGGSGYTNGEFVFKTIADLNQALPNAQAARNAVVTGYFWEQTNETTYNNSAKKYSFSFFSEAGATPAINVFVANEELLPEFSLWQSWNGSVALRLINSLGVLYFRLREAIPGFTKTYYQTEGTFGFAFTSYLLNPKQTLAITRTANTANFSAFFIGIYAQTPVGGAVSNSALITNFSSNI